MKPILDMGNLEAAADVKLGVDTSLQVNVNDILSYHLNLKPSLPLKCTLKGSWFPPLQLCMNGDADLTIGHEADLHWDLLSFEEHSHWGPQQDYDWSRPGIVDLCKDVGSSGSSMVVV